MNLRESVYSIFSALSRLYPKEYQLEYSGDMKSVFRDILDDSGRTGNWHAIRSLLRECIYLPGFLVREYVFIPKAGPIKTSRQIFTVTILGFLSLFVCYAMEYGVLRAFPNFQWMNQPGVILLLFLFDALLFGLLAGGAIGFALSVKSRTAMMAVCGVGFLVGKFLTEPSFWHALGISIRWINPDWETFFLYAASPVQGICVGLLAGLLWRGWKSGIVFALAGGLIFSAGYWVNYSSWSFLFGRGMDRLVHPQIMSAQLWILICWLIGYSIFGGTVGILWAVLLDRLPRMRSSGWPPSE